MKNKFTTILGVAALLLSNQCAFAQMAATPALQNNWTYPQSPSPEQVLQNGMQPIQNAVNVYGQRQFDMTMQLQQEALAAQQQQLDANAAAQLQAQEETGYPTTTIPNPFSQFYQDRAGASITNTLPYSGNTKIITSLNTTNDINELLRDNYGLIGVSAFQSSLQTQDAAMAQAKRVGADVVLLSSAFLGNQQVAVDQYKYDAGFFRKTKPPVLGLIGIPLPSGIRQQLERNTGVLVWIVKNDSPAFNANILEGDVILKMNDENVMSVADLIKKDMTFAGQKVDLEIWRNRQFKTISVQLNNLPGVQPVQSPSDSETQVVTGISSAIQLDREKNLAEHGDAAAQRFQGIYHLGGSGDGTPDYVEAAKWFLKAANQNDGFSELCLGDCYDGGKGVPQDYSEALKWYRKASEQGYEMAQYDLGCYYKFGKAVAKDDVEATKWFRKAADQGNANAQYSLGYCYCKGEGIETNAVIGYKWCNLASAQGNEAAQKIISILEQKMTPEQIAEGQRLTREFQPHKESITSSSN
jgi:hypothetical protein